MSLTTIFRRTDISSDPVARPAAAALAALRARLADLTAQRESWSDREQRALADVREHEAAVAELQEFEDKHVNALADRELGNPGADPDLVKVRVEEARAREQRLRERRRVAEKVLEHIRAEYGRIRGEQIDSNRQYIAHQHAAAVERLRDIAPAFLHAESQYLAILEKVYGAARAVNHFAEQQPAGLPRLAQVGDLNAANLYTWRPNDPAFDPVPQRPAIAAAIRAEADRIVEEFK